MACSDPYLTHLKQFGYNVVRLPKTDIRPGQILAQNGKDLARLGELADVLRSSTVAAPPVIADKQAANVSGQKTGELSIGVGLSILGTIIGALGGSKLGLDLKYQRARSAVFSFQDVLEDRIEVVKLDAFLAGSDVNPGSAHVRDLLFADDLYILTATIKSTKFTVEAKDENQKGVEVSIPEINGIVGGNVKVSGKNDLTSSVTYEGSIPLVFGFQAVQLDYEKGRYKRFNLVNAGDALLEAVRPALGDLKPETSWLAGRGAFVHLQGD